MFRLIAVAVAALYFVLLIFGDETRRPAEVARSEPLAVPLVTASLVPGDAQRQFHVSEISENDAVERAIAAGKKIREERRMPQPVVTMAAATEPVEPAPVETVEMQYWYVTGSRVNLRGGPGTSNSVIGQVSLGTEAEVLNDKDGWYEIRLTDGSASGWIAGQFLNEKKPG